MCSTPVILAWLGEHGVHDLPHAHSCLNPTCSLIRYKRVLLIFLFPIITLEYLDHNQGGMRSMIQATCIQLAPTQGWKNCNVCYAGWQGANPAARFSLWCRPYVMKIVHSGTNWRYGVPVETVLVESTAHSQDASRVCKGVSAVWMLTVITTTQSIMFEGSRL